MSVKMFVVFGTRFYWQKLRCKSVFMGFNVKVTNLVPCQGVMLTACLAHAHPETSNNGETSVWWVHIDFVTR